MKICETNVKKSCLLSDIQWKLQKKKKMELNFFQRVSVFQEQCLIILSINNKHILIICYHRQSSNIFCSLPLFFSFLNIHIIKTYLIHNNHYHFLFWIIQFQHFFKVTIICYNSLRLDYCSDISTVSKQFCNSPLWWARKIINFNNISYSHDTKWYYLLIFFFLTDIYLTS